MRKSREGFLFPSVRNDSSFLRVTDTQLIQITPAAWYSGGDADSPVSSVLNQGAAA